MNGTEKRQRTIGEILEIIASKTPDEMVSLQEQLIIVTAQRDQLLSSLKRQGSTIEAQDKNIVEHGIALENAHVRIRYLERELGRTQSELLRATASKTAHATGGLANSF